MKDLQGRRKVLVLTGIRSEYDILYSVMKAIEAHPGLELGVVVAGAHCSDMYGRTEELIRRDGFTVIERMETLLNSNTLAGRVKSAAIELQGLVQTVERYMPDFLLVAGDREECLVAATCGAYMNIPVAHLCGGDRVTGNTDDSVRHAVTKLAHLHFPMTQGSAARIKAMAEQDWRIFCVGNPALDRFLMEPEMDAADLFGRLGFRRREGYPLLLVVQHVMSSESRYGYEQMSVTLDAVAESGADAVIIYPNSDAGSQDIIRAIEERLPSMQYVRAYRNLPRPEFINLLRHADVLVGNSSMGIVEAPSLKLPVVNIGGRQTGREHAENVIFSGHDREEILAGIRRALSDGDFRAALASCSNPYGDGDAGVKIAEVLAGIELGRRLIVKEWTC